MDQEGIRNLMLFIYKGLYTTDKFSCVRTPDRSMSVEENVGHEPTSAEIRVELFKMKALKAQALTGSIQFSTKHPGILWVMTSAWR